MKTSIKNLFVRGTKFLTSSAGRRCRAAQIQGRAAALPYLEGEDFRHAPDLFPSIIRVWRAIRVLPALMAGLALMPAVRLAAQSFADVYNFTGNSDGANPMAGLIVSGNTIYGTALNGGDSGYGTVYSVHTDGTGFKILYTFTNGNDGAYPMAGLVLSGNMLYGTASTGGTNGTGAVFAVNTNGTVFAPLYSFTNGSDGEYPQGELVISGDTLYGTADNGGSGGGGTVFAINTNGTGFTTLYSFTYGNDGGVPETGLVLSGATLYGTTFEGGISGNGTVFAVSTDGMVFTTLHGFTGNEGANPAGGLLLLSNTLYGTTCSGGSAGMGSVFAVTTNGMVFSTLYSFTNGSDGNEPAGGLAALGNRLYGTVIYGGSLGLGTMFAVNTDGSDFTPIDFPNYNYGCNPQSGLTLSGLTLYGAAYGGGDDGEGTVFSILLPCPAISLSAGALPNGAVSVFYNQAITASGGVAPYTFVVTTGSSFPYPMYLSADGVLSGVPESTGSYAFGVTATDANGCAGSSTCSINIGPSPLADLDQFPADSGPPDFSNTEGENPSCVILSGDTLYGTARNGGANGNGTVFAVKTDGTDVRTLHSFTAASGAHTTNSDGAYPTPGLVLSGNILYGTAQEGGTNGAGTVFSVHTDGTGFATLYTFTNGSDGANPLAGLIVSGNTLYGTASYGGGSGSGGTVFALNTNGTGFTVLHNFTGNGDGYYPAGGLVLSGGTLYGTTMYGGDSGYGTVFSVSADGMVFSTLYSFSGLDFDSDLNDNTNSDGANPAAGLVLSGNTLYGTAQNGGTNGEGTVFAFNTDSMEFTTLYNFSAIGENEYGQSTNSDGFSPNAGLTLSGNTLYGTALGGGLWDFGTVFAIKTDGTGFRTVYDFNYYDGADPVGGLALSGNTLYGAAAYGGNTGSGMVFDLSTCQIITLGPGALPSGNIGDSYDQTITASGGVAPYTFAVTGGTLPGGLSLSAGGALSGTPTNIGGFSFTITGADANGCTAVNSYAITTYANFALLHSFTNGADGGSPHAGLALSGNSLYGTAEQGGAWDYGTAFAVNTDGTGFATLHSFNNFGDGFSPKDALTLSGNTLYGTTYEGGVDEAGTVFSVNNNGTDFTTVYKFTGGSDGFYPEGRLTLSGGLLYGTVRFGGVGLAGTVVAINTAGTGSTTVHPFSDTGIGGNGPEGGLVLSGNMLYGTTLAGGSAGGGAVFAVNTNGAGFTILYNFTNGSDGSAPQGGLILSGNMLYGTASGGGSSGKGTVFAVHTNGLDFQVLHSFSEGGIATIDGTEYITNSDGAYPQAGLVLSGNTLYGTVGSGGCGFGTAFAINTNGTGFTILYNFTGGSDGGFPIAPLILAGNTLYGTAVGGGISNYGTVFALGLGGVNPAVPPVVNWSAPPALAYGSALGPSQLNATANVPGNFAYNPLPGTVFSNTGVYPISVIFTPADTVHYTCLTNTVNLTVSLPQLTVTANNASRRSDAPNPAFTGTITGLVNGDAITATYSCSATDNSPPGRYLIVPSLVDPDNRATNYTVSLVDGTLTVNPIVAVFKALYGFSAVSGQPGANGDGAVPAAGLVVSGNTLFGTAAAGGAWGSGTVFAVSTDGGDFTTLYNFLPYDAGCCGLFQNNGGMSPEGTLVLSNNTLYGPAKFGGNGYVGALFELNTNGRDFETMHGFQNVYINGQGAEINSDGAFPYAGMILSNGVFYGTAVYGGSQGEGVVFSVNADMTGFTVLHNFPALINKTNSDGAVVFAGLVLSGNTLYGTAQEGGTNGSGTVFAVTTNGLVFTNLYNFTNGSDGCGPDGTLILSGGILYGTAETGGGSGGGTVFAINTNGTGFTVLHSFSALNNKTNSDGAEPLGGLALSTDGTTLYGTATIGGASGCGTVFAINTNGGSFTNLYNFTGGLDGETPMAALAAAGDSLYGTASGGGVSDNGTIFSLTCLPPALAIARSTANLNFTANFDGPYVLLTWPASSEGFSFAGFTLQSSASLSPAAWNDVSTIPAVVNGQYTVALPISASQMFYRLNQ